MPIGDPGGGEFEYTTEGLPESVFMASVPSPDPLRGVGFYTDLLGMEVLYKSKEECVVRRGSCTIRIFRSAKCGIDTGIFIGVDSPYNLHRRLVDEGVEFRLMPKRLPMGVATSFLDYDGNVLYAIETQAPIKPPEGEE
jgi:catechol 2,3-dioxygenase-like lactoylglutathione lyase family enzyme